MFRKLKKLMTEPSPDLVDPVAREEEQIRQNMRFLQQQFELLRAGRDTVVDAQRRAKQATRDYKARKKRLDDQHRAILEHRTKVKQAGQSLEQSRRELEAQARHESLEQVELQSVEGLSNIDEALDRRIIELRELEEYLDQRQSLIDKREASLEEQSKQVDEAEKLIQNELDRLTELQQQLDTQQAAIAQERFALEQGIAQLNESRMRLAECERNKEDKKPATCNVDVVSNPSFAMPHTPSVYTGPMTQSPIETMFIESPSVEIHPPTDQNPSETPPCPTQ